MTTPKLPPPPRIAQNRSLFSSALATHEVPSASTTSADSRLSMVSPYLRVRCPMPPPSVRPPTPVLPTMPGRHGRARRRASRDRRRSSGIRRRRARSARRVHMDVADRREVDDQAVVADAEPAGVVPAAANRNPQLILSPEAESRPSRRPRRRIGRSAAACG